MVLKRLKKKGGGKLKKNVGHHSHGTEIYNNQVPLRRPTSPVPCQRHTLSDTRMSSTVEESKNDRKLVYTGLVEYINRVMLP